MDPNPKTFPILSYVMGRIPTFGSKPGPSEPDIEQPPLSDPPSSPPSHGHRIFEDRPGLTDPELIAAMTRAVSDVAQTRSVLRTIGERPEHEAVDAARARVADVDAALARRLEELVLSARPAGVEPAEWRARAAAEEAELRREAEREREIYRAVVQLDEMHEAYESLLRDAEARLERIYDSAVKATATAEVEEKEEEVNEEVVGILQEASGGGGGGGGGGLERVNLSGRKLRFLPEAFGKIRGLRVFDVSGNQLEALPDSIAGLENLEELNASSNVLLSLPDSIGLLQKLKILNVSGNKLNNLPDTISHCRSLVELDASFNNLAYLPTNIGYELVNLEKLSIQLNKIRSLPTSVCEMKSLRYLDAHFNELRGLPLAIGKLVKLEVLNLSSNFSDLTELPDTFGDLTNLRELDLSNNQIHALPDTFGRLDNLVKLNLDQNPIAIPPPEVVSQGVEAVKLFMAKRWLEILVEEERRCTLEVQEEAQTGWLNRSTSWMKSYASGITDYLASPKTQKDSYLDQQL